jgi:hypothetical protein
MAGFPLVSILFFLPINGGAPKKDGDNKNSVFLWFLKCVDHHKQFQQPTTLNRNHGEANS